MSRNATLVPPPQDEVRQDQGEIRRPKQQLQSRAVECAPVPVPPAAFGHAWLQDALLENSDTRPKARTWDWIASLFVHALVLGTLILLPLYFTEAIDLREFTQTFLVAPPPPPPPPPPAAPMVAKVAQAPRRIFQVAGKLVAPTVIPESVAMLKENAEQLPPDLGMGVLGGVPGGVPGGSAGGVIGGIISTSPKTYLPPAPAAAGKSKAPVRVGGRVLPPKLLAAPDPVYPPLAKQARIQGDVLIDAVIDANGQVAEMQVVSGHPMLITAALDALRRWRYQPTILNDEPTSVQLVVTVRFRLN